MATVREHFEIDAKALNAQSTWVLQRDGATARLAVGKISYRFEENAKYWSFFMPGPFDIAYVEYLLRMPNVSTCVISDDEPDQVVGYADSPERQSLAQIRFTGRVYLYIDELLSPEVREKVADIGAGLALDVRVRDKGYVERCSELIKPLAFISHDSRDKEPFVRELAYELSTRLLSVWYDEYSLNVGDSLRENIERGLKEARKCILILSPNFISNGGWTKAEFDSIYTREIHERKNVILPVWHNVGKNEVYEFSPRLADKFGLPSSLGPRELAIRLARAIDAES
jgi:hypothetical protein